MNNKYLSAALAAHYAGLSVLPPEQDGSKAPLGSRSGDGWTRYQSERATEAEIRAWYKNGCTGVGAVMGPVSQTELFDFDDVPSYRRYMRAAEAAGLTDLVRRVEQGYSEETPHGVHWYYHCDEIDGSKKLAQRMTTPEERAAGAGSRKTLIETKGDRGYAIMAPSDGNVHPEKKAYRVITGSPATIATITPDERRDLLNLARTLDEIPAREARIERVEERAPSENTGTRPGDLFAQATSWDAILRPHGWVPVYERHGIMHWRRPGKDRGVSATTNFKGSGLFYPFTSSTEFEPNRGYSKFTAYAVLNHDGDFSVAAKELRRQGYGTDQTPARVVWDEDDEATPSDTTTHIDTETGEVVEDEPQPKPRPYRIYRGPDFLNRPALKWLVQGLIPQHGFCCVLGQPGSFKSFYALEMGLCIALGLPFYGLRVRQGSVLYVLAEGGGGFAQRMAAWALFRGIPIPANFLVLEGAVPLTTTEKVKELIRQIRDEFPDEEFEMIFLDTLNRNMPGADENSPIDMGTAVASAGLLQAVMETAVTVIHHGRNADGNIRGHSSLIGALDTVLHLLPEDDNGRKTVAVKVGKQKDGEMGHIVQLLRPVRVELPMPPLDADDDDDDLTLRAVPSSVVLEPLNADEKQAADTARRDRAMKNKARMSPQQRDVATVLAAKFGPFGATRDEWRDEWPAVGATKDQARKNFPKVIAALLEKELVREEWRSGVPFYHATSLLLTVLGSRLQPSPSVATGDG